LRTGSDVDGAAAGQDQGNGRQAFPCECDHGKCSPSCLGKLAN